MSMAGVAVGTWPIEKIVEMINNLPPKDSFRSYIAISCDWHLLYRLPIQIPEIYDCLLTYQAAICGELLIGCDALYLRCHAKDIPQLYARYLLHARSMQSFFEGKIWNARPELYYLL